MKKIKSILGIVLLMASLLLPQITVLAENVMSPQVSENYVSKLNSEGLTSARLGNCFDVYNVGNVVVNMGLDQSEYDPGQRIIFKGNIVNSNNYPLPNLKIRAKVLKIEQSDKRNRIVKTVDEFILAENLNLASLQGQDIELAYSLPIKAAQGNYEILLSVIQNDKINISGLTFADDTYGANPQFSIKGDIQEEIKLIQEGITLNDNVYDNLASTDTVFPDNKLVTIKTPIQNNTNSVQKVQISYEVYDWSDDLGNSARIKEVLNQEFELAGKSTTNAIYTITDIQVPVSYVKIIVKKIDEYPNRNWDNIANIRFISKSIAKPRIAFTGFNTSSYNPEKSLELVTCIHNVNEEEIDGIVENIVSDEKGNIIAKSQYNGKITEQIDGIYTPLPQNKSYNKLIGTSIVKDNSGNTIDSIDIVYNCKDLNPSECKNTLEDIGIWILFISLISFMGILFIGFKLYRTKRLKS